MLEQFPFTIRGFHSDNGSEFINYTVARLLEKLLIEQTKSRAHRTGDNGLVESKNGAIIRKHMGFSHIAAPHAEAVDRFHRQHLNPYVNFHRPCAVAEIVEQPNGKRRRVYRKWATPFEIFSQMPQCESFLRPGVSMAELEHFAQKQSDTEAAIAMQQAKKRLLTWHRQTQRMSTAHRTQVPERRGNDGRMESEENQKQVSLPFPPPLEIAGAIPTFPPRRPLFLYSKSKPERSPSLPPSLTSLSGSFFDENMLNLPAGFLCR